jgi:hypothetical protein
MATSLDSLKRSVAIDMREKLKIQTASPPTSEAAGSRAGACVYGGWIIGRVP